MIDLHDPKHHTVAIGVLGAAVVGSVLYGVMRLDRLPAVPVYAASESVIDALPFGKRDYVIFQASGAGKLPGELAAAIRKAGDAVQVQDALMMAHAGVVMSPDTPEVHALADALSKAINEPVTVAPGAAGDAVQIGIGPPVIAP